MSDIEFVEIPFSGNPQKYKKIAVLGSIILNTYLYLGMVGLVYGLNDQEWILGWKPIAIAVVFAVLFARIAYGWILKLDAQTGSGRGWKLESESIKLPERRTRPAK